MLAFSSAQVHEFDIPIRVAEAKTDSKSNAPCAESLSCPRRESGSRVATVSLGEQFIPWVNVIHLEECAVVIECLMIPR